MNHARPRRRPFFTVRRNALLLAAALLVLLAYVLYLALVRTTDSTATLTALSWSATQDIDQQVLVSASSRLGCPLDATFCTVRRQQVGSRRVPSGSHTVTSTTYTPSSRSCSGTGKSRSCTTTPSRTTTSRHTVTDYRTLAVYGLVYHYQLPVWRTDYTLTNSGLRGTPVAYPTPSLGALNATHRLGSHSLALSGTMLPTSGPAFVCPLSSTNWAAATLRTLWRVTRDSFDNIRSCAPANTAEQNF